MKKGFTIIEILIVILIAGTALGSLFALYTISFKAIGQNEIKLQAVNLVGEALEITRALRDESWDNLAILTPGANYYPSKSGSNWVINPGIETQGIFTRKIILENIYRDINDNIVASGGTLDPNTKKITATVSWPNQNISFSTYLTNWK